MQLWRPELELDGMNSGSWYQYGDIIHYESETSMI